MTKIIDGKKIAEEIRQDVKEATALLKETKGFQLLPMLLRGHSRRKKSNPPIPSS